MTLKMNRWMQLLVRSVLLVFIQSQVACKANSRNSHSHSEIGRIICTGTVDDMREWIRNGGDINARIVAADDPLIVDATPILGAAMKGRDDLIVLLIEEGADVDARDKNGSTVLQWASTECDISTLQKLIEAGSDINARNQHNQTALMRAAAFDSKLTGWLLEHGADPNIQADGGWSAVVFAAEHDNLEALRLLLDRGARTDLKLPDGRTATHFAASASRNGTTVEILVTNGAPVDAPDVEGVTPLMLACAYGDADTVAVLLDAGANVNAASNLGETPLLEAARNMLFEDEQIQKVTILLEAGADIEARNNLGRTALLEAVRTGFQSVAELLVEAGANVDARDKDGRGIQDFADARLSDDSEQGRRGAAVRSYVDRLREQ